MPSRGRLRVVCAILLLALAGGAAGYAVGRSGGEDIDDARAQGRAAGIKLAREEAERRGYDEGHREGERSGYRSAYRQSFSAARRKAEEGARPAVVVDEPDANPPTEPLEHCVYGPRRFCTRAENQREGDVERLCGPGTPEGRREAERQGIQC